MTDLNGDDIRAGAGDLMLTIWTLQKRVAELERELADATKQGRPRPAARHGQPGTTAPPGGPDGDGSAG